MGVSLRRVRVAGAALISLALAGCVQSQRPAPSHSLRPSIVLVLADDLDAQAPRHMRRLCALLGAAGAGFENAFTTVALCAPSRASFLTGRYAHNHGVRHNGGAAGGFAAFRASGGESSNVATWLKAAGYHTGLLGKYLNGYPGDVPTHVPPGWDEWHAVSSARGSDTYFDYDVNENGVVVKRGSADADYGTDVLAEKAVALIERWSRAGEPFFLVVAPAAPHLPAAPAPRHRGSFPDARAPRVASFDEQDVSDKPAWVRNVARLRRRQVAGVDRLYRKRLQSLQAVDEMLERIVLALETRGRLDSTYLFFTSDNGFLLGEHRILQGKAAPYEEAVRVPLLVRGPGVPAGVRLQQLVANIDLAPTFAAIAGTQPPGPVDGVSLLPLLEGRAAAPGVWREALLLEGWADGEAAVPEYRALRSQERLYIEYATGERELYDLAQDPFQLSNLQASSPPEVVRPLAERLRRLRSCAGRTCQEQ